MSAPDKRIDPATPEDRADEHTDDARDTAHATGEDRAAQNVEDESPS